MNQRNASQNFLLLALSGSLVLVYLIAKPFLGPLILASVFAFLFQPVYRRLLITWNNHESLAALATTLLALILILIPLGFLGSQIFKESSQLYESLTNESDGFEVLIKDGLEEIQSMFPAPAGFEPDVEQYAKQGLEKVTQNLGSIFSSFAQILLSTLVFLTAFYFLLKDGTTLKNYLVAISPLKDRDDEFIVSRIKSSVSAAVKGNVAIGLIQGVLTGIGFAIFGVPNAALWGGVAAIAAFLPGIGTALVLAPAIIFLFVTGNSFGGVGLLIWGIIAVGLVDNFLGPKLMGRGMQLHPLVVFISVLGGIAFFGPLGFLLGPLVVSVCLALIEIYTLLNREDRKAQ